MSLEKILKKQLPAALFTQVMDSLGDDFDFDYVPRSRLNSVIKQRNDLRQKLDVDDVEDDDSGDTKNVATIKPPKVDTASPDIAALEAKHKAELEAVKLQFALTDALKLGGCNNPKLLIPQLDMQAIKLSEKGELEGLADQITAWKTSDPYLFKTSEEAKEDGTGATGLGDSSGGSTKKVKQTALDLELDAIFGVVDPGK